MNYKLFRNFFIFIFIVSIPSGSIFGEIKKKAKTETKIRVKKNDTRPKSKVLYISLAEFIDRVLKNDPNFSLILVDELYLKYQKDLQLPLRDLIVDITSQYDLFLPADNQNSTLPWEGSVSLSKLFPYTGTALSARYNSSLFQNQSGIFNRSSVNLSLSQSILQNAFGVLTRLKEKKIDIEIEVARFIIIEAYEEYLATLIQIYLDWFTAMENLKATRATLKYNLDLLRSIKRKFRYRVAFKEDVHKMELEVLIVRENLLELENRFYIKALQVRNLCGTKKTEDIKPEKPSLKFEKQLAINLDHLLTRSRSYKILKSSKNAALLAKDIARRTLLPELNLFMGYQVFGQSFTLQDAEHTIYGGLSTRLNFGKQKEKAVLEIKSVDLRKKNLEMQRKMFDLNLYTKELQLALNKQLKRITFAKKKFALSGKILQAERQNYNIGRKTLDDLILAKKSLESSRYNIINQEMIYQSLVLEWFKTTDQIVRKKNDIRFQLKGVLKIK